MYDNWWYDPYWSWEYRWNSYAWDPWFDRFYDPWYWDPYGGYNAGYGYNYSYYYRYPSGQYWYYQRGTVAASSDDGHKQRRPRNRRGWPANQGGQMANNPLAGSVNKASSAGGGSRSGPTQRRGSVRKAGNRVRITAQLIDGTTGGHLWAERYDRELDDIFEVQDDVTGHIVAALKIVLTPDETERIKSHGTENMAAYDYALRGRELGWRLTAE
ncbi:MAG: hypothetical protein IIC41_04325, partial [Candidatus Marinimicrobia bacterium]|nr:hypothetical protein [Candidatus Neomarinimicrobiota bacterium]